MLPKAQFEQAQQFCQGEYQGDLATLQAVMADAVQPTVTLDSDTASKLTKKVLEAYLNCTQRRWNVLCAEQIQMPICQVTA